MMKNMYEFFAGGGMARLGLGNKWTCTFANEWSEKKAASYKANFLESTELLVEDIKKLTAADLPGKPYLVWGSFPCQDLSLAGSGAGLKGHRSGTFHHFWRLIQELNNNGRAPQVCVLENVVGAITSHGGKDFQSIIQLIVETGYKVGALVVDARLFLPQSRPRLFIIASKSTPIKGQCVSNLPNDVWHPKNLINAYKALPEAVKESWIWWDLPRPKIKIKTLADILEDDPNVRWNSEEETQKLLEMMAESNIKKVRDASKFGKKVVGTIYKRMRLDPNGQKIQRAEVRFDGVAGCLRTPAGGSSRQTVIIINGTIIKTRLLSSREVARLMGVDDSYLIPTKYNESYHLFGDGVAVPVVKHINDNLLRYL